MNLTPSAMACLAQLGLHHRPLLIKGRWRCEGEEGFFGWLGLDSLVICHENPPSNQLHLDLAHQKQPPFE